MSDFLYQFALVFFDWGYIANMLIGTTLAAYATFNRKWRWMIAWALIMVVMPFGLLFIKNHSS